MKSYYFFFFLICAFSNQLFAQKDSTDTIRPNGYITFQFNVDSAFLILNNQFDEMKWVHNGQTISAPRGLTSVKLSVLHDYLFEEIFTLPSEGTKVLRHDFKDLPLNKDVLDGNYAAKDLFNANLLIVTDQQTEIILNNELVGTEYSFTDGLVGNNRLEINHPSLYSSAFFRQSYSFSNSDRTLKVVERYIKPLESRSKQLALLPGFSQAYKYQFLKSNLIRIGFAAAFISTSTFEIKYRVSKKEFDDLLIRYQNTESFVTATGTGDKLDDLKSELDRDALIRNLSLFTLISVYSYNLLDGFFSKPKVGYRTKKPLEFIIKSNDFTSLNAGFRIKMDVK